MKYDLNKGSFGCTKLWMFITFIFDKQRCFWLIKNI